MKFKFLSFCFAMSMLTACSQTDEPGYKPVDESIQTRSHDNNTPAVLNTTLAQRKQLAMWFVQNYSLEDSKRVHRAVRHALSAGLDEVFFIKEYASQNPSINKISAEPVSETAKTLIKDCAVNVNKAYSSNSNVNAVVLTPDLLNNDYLQIYWPYSENWDYKTDPVIVFAPDNINCETTTGYVVSGVNGILRPIKVSDSFCQSHPVWIINESEIGYSDLPDFRNKEYKSSDGTVYSQALVNKLDSVSFDKFESLMTLYLGQVKSTKNHDSWIAGGSEYVFRFGSYENTNLTCEADTSKCTPLISKTRITFSRSEIKKQTTKKLMSIALSEWPQSLKAIAMTLVEEDSGKETQTFDTKLELTWEGKSFGLNISISNSEK